MGKIFIGLVRPKRSTCMLKCINSYDRLTSIIICLLHPRSQFSYCSVQNFTDVFIFYTIGLSWPNKMTKQNLLFGFLGLLSSLLTSLLMLSIAFCLLYEFISEAFVGGSTNMYILGFIIICNFI